MFGRYKGMQQKLLETNKLAMYVPRSAHSLNLLGQGPIDYCKVAVNFFSVPCSYSILFLPQTVDRKFLKVVLEITISGCIR